MNKELIKYKPSNDFVNGRYKNNFHDQMLPIFNRRLSLKPDSIVSSPFSKHNSSLIDPYDMNYNNNVKASKLYLKNNFDLVHNNHISISNSPPSNNNPNFNNYTFQNGLTVDPQLKEENIRSRGYKIVNKEQPWNNYHKVEKWLENKIQEYPMTVLSTKTPIVRQTPNFLK
ncbi:hypothetical protein K502DRAFT_330532 [Neoconidiobolus thromboides FSU 785]|nr:hypothetical protein K502DRAFT_330532 [Neoconidiobolus thromboides FSU 785]